MSHPITGSRRSVWIYSLIWLIIAMLHGLMLRFFFDFSPTISVSEALISGIFFGFLGLLAWYPTRYIPFQRSTPFYSLIAHVVAAMLVLLVWLLLTAGLLNAIFVGQKAYLEFLNNTLIWRSVFGAITYLVLVLIYYLASYSQKLKERGQQEERLKTLVRDAELNMLKSQINPHFLFNSLHSISSLIFSNPEEARDMIIRLSDFLRYSLKHRENKFIPLKEELGRMRDYLSIEKIRFGEKLLYEFRIQGDCENFPVPTMIFQPLFENAIRHSVYESVEPVQIQFECRFDGAYMRTTIINDYDPELPSRKGTGVGLQNVRQRIAIAYDSKGSVQWSTQEGKFVVHLLFPRILSMK